jgi:hypothetical protein
MADEVVALSIDDSLNLPPWLDYDLSPAAILDAWAAQ